MPAVLAPITGCLRLSVRQGAEQLGWEPARTLIAIGGAHFDTNQLWLRFRADLIEPTHGFRDGLIQAAVAVVELLVRFAAGVNTATLLNLGQ